MAEDDLPDFDFSRIRPYGQPPSRANAFEELASVLIEQGISGVIEWPDGVHFFRFGNPDGGREGKGELPNGDVWAWQAKYLFEFDSSAVSQITKSVRRALEREPNLKRYFVALPLDLSAGDTAERTSAYTRWTEKASEWKALARETGQEVDFTFVGAHQLVTALTEPRHAGRARYWFGKAVLTPEWLGRRLEEVVEKAGRRYTPRLHVEVDTVHALDAVGRAEAYVQRWQGVLAALRDARRWPWRAPGDAREAFDGAISRCDAAVGQADSALESMIAAARTIDDLPEIEATLDEATEAVSQLENLLRTHSLREGGYYVGDAASLYSDLRGALSALRSSKQLARWDAARAAREKLLLLTGRAGVGKTHLLCDVAGRRIAEGRPTVLLLGQDFDRRSLLSQIGELTQLGGSPDEVFAVLDAAAESAQCIGLLLIDALNEGEEPGRWRDDVRALIASAARYQNVALVLSCRTEFVDAVVGDVPVARIEHIGFAEATDLAVLRFTQEYGLEPPTFPVLDPEFSNPLYLKLTCDALVTLGRTRFPFGAAGLVTVCDAFLEAVNERLSEPARSDYDGRGDLVGRVIRELARLGRGPWDRTDVQRICDEALPDRPWSRSLMRGLINEGVLVELGDGRIDFGYQRLGDVARAAAIAEKSVDDIRTWLGALAHDVWRERGLLSALAVVVPERHGVELIDLGTNDDGEVSYDVVDSFLESLLLRSPDSISPRTVEVVKRILDDGYRAGDIWDRLIRIACVPNHPLNAEWLHARLAEYEVAERDQSWSTWLVGAMDMNMGTAIRRLIEWAWPPELEDRATVPDDVAVLVTQMLGWLLTTTDRRVRDRATKAIVSVAERAPAAFAKAIARFHGTNDPYVTERLAAAACGVVLRTDESETAHRIAEAVVELFTDSWPEHLLTRDFIRRILRVAHDRGWSGPDFRPPYDSQWPVPTRSVDEIEALAGPPDYAYGSIWHSLSGMGDFGRYVLQPALRDIVSDDAKTLQHDVERAVFDRVLELGWTPERFRETDSGRSGGRDGVVERVGKKYQWIGFYETVGRIADHYAVKTSWSDEEPRPYEYAEQLVWRDIDPTVLVRQPVTASTPERQWFSPVDAQFPTGIPDECPRDMTSVPDPLDLIGVSDPDGVKWLVLVSNPDWDQPLDPEIKALRAPWLRVWMQLHAYLAPVADVTAMREWAAGKDWFGKWMPDFPEGHNVLLGSHPDHPDWAAADGTLDWWDARASKPPADLLQCAAWYGGTGTSRDASAEEETRGYVPTRPLLDALGLSRGVDFMWNDASGMAAHDPSVRLGGPATLAIRRDVVSRLTDAGLTVFWTVLVGAELHRSDHMPPDDGYRWISASASYILVDRIEQIDARAVRRAPGPIDEQVLNWVTKSAEG